MFKLLLYDLKTFFLLLSFSLVIVLGDDLKLLNPVKSYAQIITTPIQYGIYRNGHLIVRQLEFIFLARRAAQENKALTEQLASILSENANLRRKLAEAEGFLDQKNSLNPQTFDLVAARPMGISRYLLIDKGSDDNLKDNQPVVYKDNYIGKIKELNPKQAKVILSSDPDSKIAAFVANKDGRARGILSGQFGSEMLLDKVLHNEPIVNGDLVYSEGIEVDIPRGLVLGTVSDVLERQNEIFKQAKIKPIFDVSNLDIVFVITN